MREFDGAAWLVGMLLLTVLLVVLRRRGAWFLVFFSVFWVYVLVLVSVTLFPMPLVAENDRVGALAQIYFRWRYSGLNLVPFYFGNCWDLPQPCAQGILENILMTMPFGFGINFLTRLRNRDIIWLAILPGLGIEGSQLLMGLVLGSAYRTVDVNDVLFNAAGFWLGAGAFRFFAWLIVSLIFRLRLKQNGLCVYILRVME